MRILFLSRWLPFPVDNGSKIRVFNLLRTLGSQHTVTLASFFGPHDRRLDPKDSGLSLQEFHSVPWPAATNHGVRSNLWLLSRTPRSFLATHSREMAALVTALVSRNQYDLIIASQVQMAAYSRYFQGRPALLEELEFGAYHQPHSEAGSLRAKARSGLTWAKHKHFVGKLLKDFRRCTVVSEPERGLLSDVAPGFSAVDVVPNAIDLQDYAGVEAERKPNTLVFTGSLRYRPNHEAMVWFLEEIYPRIFAEIPETRMVILGDHGNLELPSAPNVTRTGWVEDVRPVIASSSVSVVPIVSGGGTRLKILESMALRTPVVTTSKGAEGIDCEAGEHLLQADDRDRFAAAVLQLLRHPEQRRRIAGQARRLVETRYDWRIIERQFLDVVERAANGQQMSNARQRRTLISQTRTARPC